LTQGRNNTTIGHDAGRDLTTGGFNVFHGALAGQNMTTGSANVIVGSGNMTNITSGDDNTIIGAGSIGEVAVSTSVSANTAIGRRALGNIRSGNNTAIGFDAGRFSASGINDSSTNSIYIGYDSRPSLKTNTNETVIGYQGRGNGSNTTTLGNSSTVGTYIPAGESYFGTTTDAGDYRVQVSGNQYVSGNIISNSRISAATEFRLSDFAFSRVAKVDANGGFGGGYNSNVVGVNDIRAQTGAGASSIYYSSDGTIRFYSESQNANIAIAERMRIAIDGKVGIGTTSASELLDVNGRARVRTIDYSASPINMLWADVDGVVRKAPVPTASVSGGTTDLIPLWSSSTALTSSVIKQVSSEILIGYTTDQGTFKLQVDGNGFFNGTIKTASPSGDPAAPWKLGKKQAGSVSLDTGNYVEVEIDGTYYRLAIVTAN
jgi:hypothetical protein